MKRESDVSLMLCTTLCLLAGGCSNTGRITNRTCLLKGDLDECRRILLSYDKVHEQDGLFMRHYDQLTIRLEPREELREEHPVAKRPPGGALRYEGVQARVDSARQKVWFVERDTRRVIATYDRETGETTGPDDETPPWATPDGGEPL